MPTVGECFPFCTKKYMYTFNGTLSHLSAEGKLAYDWTIILYGCSPIAMTLFSWVSDAVRKLLPFASCRKPLAHHTSGNQSPASPYKDLCSVPGAAYVRFVMDRVAKGKPFSEHFGFPMPIITRAMLHIYPSSDTFEAAVPKDLVRNP